MIGVQPTREPEAYPGLHAALMAAVRPEFRADMLVIDRADPVFGGPPCAVTGCLRAARLRSLCDPHYNKWLRQGRPDIPGFAASAERAMREEKLLRSCTVPGCGYGHMGAGLCTRHHQAWLDASRPDLPGWLASPAAVGILPGQSRCCLVPSCGLWAESCRTVLCHLHRLRWHRVGKPPVEDFAMTCDTSLAAAERIDFRPLRPARLRMEMQYAVQQRSDNARVPTPPAASGT